jgi:hypothetical protein
MGAAQVESRQGSKAAAVLKGAPMKLLAAIDSSAYSQQALEEIARRPWPPETTVRILHVIDWPQLPNSASPIQTLKESANFLVEAALRGWITSHHQGHGRTP